MLGHKHSKHKKCWEFMHFEALVLSPNRKGFPLRIDSRVWAMFRPGHFGVMLGAMSKVSKNPRFFLEIYAGFFWGACVIILCFLKLSWVGTTFVGCEVPCWASVGCVVFLLFCLLSFNQFFTPLFVEKPSNTFQNIEYINK